MSSECSHTLPTDMRTSLNPNVVHIYLNIFIIVRVNILSSKFFSSICSNHSIYSLALTLCMLGNCSCFFCRLLLFSKISIFKNQRAKIGLDPDQDCRYVCPELVQAVCKCYQQMTKLASSKERVIIIRVISANT